MCLFQVERLFIINVRAKAPPPNTVDVDVKILELYCTLALVTRSGADKWREIVCSHQRSWRIDVDMTHDTSVKFII